MKSVGWLGKKAVQVGKWIITNSTEFLESQYETLQSFSYNQFTSFYRLFNWAQLNSSLGERESTYLYLTFITG